MTSPPIPGASEEELASIWVWINDKGISASKHSDRMHDTEYVPVSRLMEAEEERDESEMKECQCWAQLGLARAQLSASAAEVEELRMALNTERVSKCQWISKEAVARISALEAERDRYRVALEEIGAGSGRFAAGHLSQVARAALSSGQEKQGGGA